jgi:hypothetical protein
VLSLRHEAGFVDTTFEHADGADAVAMVPGARLAVTRAAFLEGEVPLGWLHQGGNLALGNVTIAAGLLPRVGRLAAISVRIAAPTAPELGPGMMTAGALAKPRIVDPELFEPHQTSAELLADWRWRGAAWWLQVESGIAANWPTTGYQTVLRASFAGGLQVAPWLDLAATFATRSFLLAHNARENFVHTLILGIVAHVPRGQLALRLEVPIDTAARDANEFVVGVELRGR